MNLAAPYKLNSRVGLRIEPFGATAYHYDTRRLVFMKTVGLVDLIQSLESYGSADGAIDAAAGGEPKQVRQFEAALSSLVDSGIVCER